MTGKIAITVDLAELVKIVEFPCFYSETEAMLEFHSGGGDTRLTITGPCVAEFKKAWTANQRETEARRRQKREWQQKTPLERRTIRFQKVSKENVWYHGFGLTGDQTLLDYAQVKVRMFNFIDDALHPCLSAVLRVYQPNKAFDQESIPDNVRTVRISTISEIGVNHMRAPFTTTLANAEMLRQDIENWTKERKTIIFHYKEDPMEI